ncbi:hypothetical protein PQ610_02090 [Tardisphaera miroshnichenkoae]
MIFELCDKVPALSLFALAVFTIVRKLSDEPLAEMEVIVLSINIGFDSASGDPAYKVDFGTQVDATSDILARMRNVLPQGSPATGKKIPIAYATIWFKQTDEPAPFKVGDKYIMTISKHGAVTLVRLNEQPANG